VKQLLYWFVYLVTMLGLVLLGDPVFRLESFFVLFFAACLSHHFAVTAGKQSRTSRTSLLLVVVSLPWFISEPYLSDDVYRYALEGKAITQGVDVYQQAPSQYAKEVLLEVAGKVNHPELSSIYPPAALGFFAVSSFIPLEPLQSLRLLLFVCLLTLQRVLKAALRFEGQSVSKCFLLCAPSAGCGGDDDEHALGSVGRVICILCRVSAKASSSRRCCAITRVWSSHEIFAALAAAILFESSGWEKASVHSLLQRYLTCYFSAVRRSGASVV